MRIKFDEEDLVDIIIEYLNQKKIKNNGEVFINKNDYGDAFFEIEIPFDTLKRGGFKNG